MSVHCINVNGFNAEDRKRFDGIVKILGSERLAKAACGVWQEDHNRDEVPTYEELILSRSRDQWREFYEEYDESHQIEPAVEMDIVRVLSMRDGTFMKNVDGSLSNLSEAEWLQSQLENSSIDGQLNLFYDVNVVDEELLEHLQKMGIAVHNRAEMQKFFKEHPGIADYIQMQFEGSKLFSAARKNALAEFPQVQTKAIVNIGHSLQMPTEIKIGLKTALGMQTVITISLFMIWTKMASLFADSLYQ